MVQSTKDVKPSSDVTATAWPKPAHEFDKRFRDPEGKLWHELEVKQLAAAAGDLPVPSHVLEVGCGTGRFTEIMARRGHYIRGVEPSTGMLTEAKKKVGEFPNAVLIPGEGASLPFDSNHFDLVYTIRVVNHTESRDYAFRMIFEMIRVTRPGRRVLIEFANRSRPRRRSTGTTLSVTDFEQLARDHGTFRLVHLDGILIFSITLLQFVPRFLLPVWFGFDRFLARRFPRLASRCFVLLEKL